MSVTELPLQIEDDEGLIETVGEFTVTNVDAVAEHPPALVPVTVYVVEDVGLTVILAVVAPLLQ